MSIYGYQNILQDIKTPYRMQTYRAVWICTIQEKNETKTTPPQSPTQTPQPEALQLPPSVHFNLFTRKGVPKARRTQPPHTLRAPAAGDGEETRNNRGPSPAPAGAVLQQRCLRVRTGGVLLKNTQNTTGTPPPPPRPDLWSRAVHAIPVPLSFGSHRAHAAGCCPGAAGTCLVFVTRPPTQRGERGGR